MYIATVCVSLAYCFFIFLFALFVSRWVEEQLGIANLTEFLEREHAASAALPPGTLFRLS